MPTYDYVCDACEHRFEEFQYMSEEPLKLCPQCNKRKLRRLFGTGAAVLFKGSGFYETDYRSESYKSAAKSDQEKTGAKTESTASEAKPDKSANGKSGKGSGSGEKSPKSAT